MQAKAASDVPGYTKIFAQSLLAEAECGDKIVAVTVAMPDGTGLDLFAAHNSGPIAFRYPRGEGTGVDMPARGVPLEIGKGRIIQSGQRVALLSFGTRLAEVLKAAEALQSRGLTPTVADTRFAKPLNRDPIVHLARNHEALITIEKGSIGGFGPHVAQLLAEEAIFDTGLKYRSMVLPDIFIDQSTPKAMYRVAAARIEAKVLETLGVAVVEKRA